MWPALLADSLVFGVAGIPVLVGVLVGVFVSLFGVLIEPWKVAHVIRRFGPRLKVAFDENDGIVGPIARSTYREYYVRLKVDNTGKRTAKNCGGYLVAVHMIDDRGRREPTAYKDFQRLCWSYFNEDKSWQGLSLHPHTSYYLDVFHTHSERNGFCPRIIPGSPRYTDLFHQQGIYCLTIRVVADDCDAVETDVYVQWQMNWETFRVADSLAGLRSERITVGPMTISS